MDALFGQLKGLVDTGGEGCRKELLARLDDLQMRLQTPLETHIRHRKQVRLNSASRG